MTYLQAVKKAMHLSDKYSEDYYVIYENGEYDVADDFELETYHLGNSPIGYAGYGLGYESL